MTTIIPIVADLHVNSKVGLLPPVVELDGVGSPGEYHASKMQRVMWEKWCEFWTELRLIKEQLGARLYPVVNGDGSDDNKYDPAGMITANKSDIKKLAVLTLQPMLAIADKWFMVRGTKIHTGAHSWYEETIAEEAGAEPDREANTFSWWWWPAVIEGVKFHVAHKPPTFGHKPWTIDAAVGRCSKEVRDIYVERDELPPDIAAFAHYHRLRDSGRVKKPFTVFVPSWTFAGEYIMGKGKTGPSPVIGGVWFICEDGKYKFDYRAWRLGGKKPWKEELV